MVYQEVMISACDIEDAIKIAESMKSDCDFELMSYKELLEKIDRSELPLKNGVYVGVNRFRLDDLLKLLLIEKDQKGYKLTDAGRRYLQG